MEFFISFRKKSPKHFQSTLQFLTFKSLNELQADYEWMEQKQSASAENELLQEADPEGRVPGVTLLKCEPAESYFLLLTDREKVWQPEDLCDALEIPQIRKASKDETLRILETDPEESTVFSIFLNSAQDIQIVMDREIAEAEELLFRDGSAMGFLKIKTADLLERLLPYTGHSVVLIG